VSGLSRRALVAAAVGAAVVPARAAQVERFDGKAALPPISALDFEGRKLPVPAAGRAVVVNFWATWCPPCRAEMPLLLQLSEIYGDKLQLQLVNFKERAATVQRYMRDSAWSMPVLLDPAGEAAQAWGVKRFPTTIGFDAKGKPRWRVTGELDWSTADAGKLVEGLWA
jgi:thiol-disulfide isomerase/thioredoxin